MVRSWDVALDIEPIDAREILAEARRLLVDELALLGRDAWLQPSVLPGWDVHDICIHLLGNDLGRLRRAWLGGPPSDAEPEFGALAERIERSNEAWVAAGRRIPPDLLVQWLATTGPRVDDVFQATDPWAVSTGVAWTGAGLSPAWLDIAREYTEHWVHAQQIRLALARPAMTGRRWLHPVLDAFLRALPRAYDATEAPLGTTVEVQVEGDAGGRWAVSRAEDRWRLVAPGQRSADARVTVPDATAWKVFSRLPGARLLRGSVVRDGDPALTEPATRLVAVMTTDAA